jgi:glycosyltransferase involved in cell wall biosynthesis
MSDKSKKSVSLILPVYNEKTLLAPAVERCISALSADFEDYEIILVDDGSTDGITDLLTSLETRSQHLKVMYNVVNLNVGIAVQRGMMSARCEYIVHNAVDLPLAPEELAKILEEMDDCDLLVLERSTYAGYMKWRVVTSVINRLLLKLFFSSAVRGIVDLNFTQIYRKEIVPKILPLAKSPAFTTPEMIIRAKFLKFRVKSALVDYKPRLSGKGAFGKPHDIMWSMYDMFRFRMKLWRNRSRTLYGKNNPTK